MPPRLTHTELAEAHGRADWRVLWEHAIPLVKMTVGRMARSKEMRRDVTDDLMQEGMLIAGEAMRTWDPVECAYSTHITRKVGWGTLETLTKRHNGGIGGKDQRPALFSLGDSRDGMFGLGADPDGEQGEDEDDGTFEAGLTYAGVRRSDKKGPGQYDGMGVVPEGYADPGEEADRQQQEDTVAAAVKTLKPRDQKMIRSVFGFGQKPEHIDAFASRTGATPRAIYRRRREVLKRLSKKLPNPHHNKYGSKEDARDTQQR